MITDGTDATRFMAMTLAKYAALESGFLATHARAALQAIQELTDVLSEEVVSDLQASTVQVAYRRLMQLRFATPDNDEHTGGFPDTVSGIIHGTLNRVVLPMVAEEFMYGIVSEINYRNRKVTLKAFPE
eukprot:gene8928-3813_t